MGVATPRGTLLVHCLPFRYLYDNINSYDTDLFRKWRGHLFQSVEPEHDFQFRNNRKKRNADRR